ncbi:MAG: alpha/beta fold hydrolase [Clostridia bacterium]
MDYKVEKIEFKSADKIHMIKGKIYIPKNKEDIKGIIQISHGMCEYIGRYTKFFEYMVKQGFVVCGHDHLGHGESVFTDEELGFFADENGYKLLVQDLHHFTNIIKSKFVDKPIFLFGHSMGSFIVRCYLSKYGNQITGAIICGTCGLTTVMDPAIKATEMVEKKKGKMYRSKFINDIAFGAFNLKFQPIKTRYDWVSTDEEIVKKYSEDTRCNFVFTTRAFNDLFHLISWCNSTKCFKKTPDALPLLIISGSLDPVGEYSEGVLKVYKLFVENDCKDATLKLYSKLRHELLNEVNYKVIYKDIQNWIENKINT